MEHYAPHTNAKFEGFYSKFGLPSGAHIALIICSVPKATTLPPHMVSFTYYPKTGTDIFRRDQWVQDIYRIKTDGKTHAFELRVPGVGFMRCDADSTTEYSLDGDGWSIHAKTKTRTPWQPRMETPEGWMVRLPLPLHWHVHSLNSLADCELEIPSVDLPKEDNKGWAMIHQEKNWASSFPSAHMWIQAFNRDTGSTICLAGGKILGMTAYLVGYRSKDLDISFRPPFSLALFGWSPTMSVDVNWKRGAFNLGVTSFWKKLEIEAVAPKDRGGWFGLPAPFSEGHRENFLTESFLADVKVTVFEKEGWIFGGWRQVKRESFKNASLEFGGDYFPDRGT
ncbi:hypothetical protein M011DRAFT_467178 [Sporormia fimetaria CBS 119925]|uniref:Tocopherol cyclase-like protein n=1 Tax=Sporormia fimetaria CBS 119925 TaxID=1340428 RepID=A0A6A6VEJ3_9PLEO|nr:hypothetical protein M011DRAFT_467178 [Sporormia fimetaria CBS 119925]